MKYSSAWDKQENADLLCGGQGGAGNQKTRAFEMAVIAMRLRDEPDWYWRRWPVLHILSLRFLAQIHRLFPSFHVITLLSTRRCQWTCDHGSARESSILH